MILEEKDFKTRLRRNDIHPRCLLYGDENLLKLSYRKKLYELYDREGCACEVYESRDADFNSLLESFGMISLMGGQRAVFIDDFESSLVPPELWEDFLKFCQDASTGDKLVITTSDNFDPKGKAKDKKLLALFSKDLYAVNILRHTGSLLRDEIRTLCKKDGADLSGDLANYMIEICGEDLELLKNECIKLCTYVGEGGTITKEHIDTVCAKKAEANLYNLTSLILAGDVRQVMSEIDTLLAQKTAVIQIVINLVISFCGLYSAACAREKGKSSESAAKDLNEKFPWRMRNYFRDSSKYGRKNIYKALDIFTEAESDLKSKSQEDRVTLELACIRACEALRERQ